MRYRYLWLSLFLIAFAVDAFAGGSRVSVCDGYYVQTVRVKADGGDSAAQQCLAFAYRDGVVFKKSSDRALAYFTKAADQGEALSQFELGLMYWSGDAVERDYVVAVEWLEASAGKRSNRLMSDADVAAELERLAKMNVLVELGYAPEK